MMLAALTLALLTLIGIAALLGALRQPLNAPQEASPREALEEDYHATLGALRELDTALSHGEVDPRAGERERRRLQARAARTLGALENLPPAAPKQVRSPLLPAALGLLGVAALVVVGAYTFIPRWQLAGLAPGEAFALKSAVRLPGLAAQAARSGASQDYLAWGRAAFDAGRYPEAGSAYATVLRSNPQQPEALRRLGMILIQAGDKAQEGFTFVQVAARLEPKSDEGQLFLGFALARLGQDTQAMQALRRYQQLSPGGRDADDLLATLRARQGVDRGEALYRQLGCASCHAADGGGGVGPSLRSSPLSREAMAQIIRRGAAGMPAYPEDRLSAAQLGELLGLIGSWQQAGR